MASMMTTSMFACVLHSCILFCCVVCCMLLRCLVRMASIFSRFSVTPAMRRVLACATAVLNSNSRTAWGFSCTCFGFGGVDALAAKTCYASSSCIWAVAKSCCICTTNFEGPNVANASPSIGKRG